MEPLFKAMAKAKRVSRSFGVRGSTLEPLQRTPYGCSQRDPAHEDRKEILKGRYEALENEAANLFAAAGRNER
jgi:hypothetical protein